MKINKFYIFFLSFLIFITSCQGLKEGLVGNKRSKSSDEFLVQKKNPLVLPPDFETLPTPKSTYSGAISTPFAAMLPKAPRN